MKCNAPIDSQTKMALEGEALSVALKDPGSSRCGYELSSDDVFCPSCGAKVERAVQPEGKSDKESPVLAAIARRAKKFLKFKRATRKEFWMASIALIAVDLTCRCLGAVCGDAGDVMVSKEVYEDISNLFVFFAFLGLAVYGHFAAVSGNRLRDMNISGWLIQPVIAWTILIVGPIVCFCKYSTTVAIIDWGTVILHLGLIGWLGFAKGTVGPNKYGPDPLAGK